MNDEIPLLSIIELGGYPDFNSLYKRYGFKPVVAYSMRKALGVLKKIKPAVVVAEFNYQSDFRDRTSSLESLIAVAQRHPTMNLIIFFVKEYRHQFERLQAMYTFFETYAYPINQSMMEEALNRLISIIESN